MSAKYLCVHGHFYQPPRENPWLEEVEVQDSAAPFHDWNARILAECYGPNSASRQLAHGRKIADIVSNYAHMSFNFGPTLLAWMERANPDVYRRILEADRQSVKERSGHGNAIAQVYNHMIMPLANENDRVTQVRWGIRDFQHRFGRDPEGMWLAETAVDTPTLEVLVDHGIRFTILSPYQAARVREVGGPWVDATGGRVDPTRPYRVMLPDGRSIAVFFYDGPIARSLAFEDGLRDSDSLLDRLARGYDGDRRHPQILNIATDGETFGHHRKQGDEVLAGVFSRAHEKGLTLTNYGEYLERYPPTAEAELIEGSSWSCTHGIERWRSDCGCRTSGDPRWTQAWRAPLRGALDLLREHLSEQFEELGAKLFLDPWEARNGYIDVVLERTPERIDRFLRESCGRELSRKEQVTALKLLECQRHAMLMYTSCGWFFSEISGLETVQILKYAARSIQLAAELGEPNLEAIFLEALEQAPSNLPELGNGAVIYQRYVKPSIISMESVAAHLAIAGIFDDQAREGRIFCFDVAVPSWRHETVGSATLGVGHMQISSLTTREQLDVGYAVIHFGGSDVRATVRPFQGEELQQKMREEVFRLFNDFDLTEVVRALDHHFKGRDYTLRNLFVDERRRMVDLLLRDSIARCDSDFQRIYDENVKLMHFLEELSIPVPAPLRSAAQVALSSRADELLAELCDGKGRVAHTHGSLIAIETEARRLGIQLDLGRNRERFEALLADRMTALCASPSRRGAREVLELLSLAEQLRLYPNLWRVQNDFFQYVAQGAPGLEADLVQQLAERLYFERSALEAKLRHARRSHAPETSVAAGIA